MAPRRLIGCVLLLTALPAGAMARWAPSGRAAAVVSVAGQAPSPTLAAATVTPASAQPTPTLQAATVTPVPATPGPSTADGVLADERFTGPSTIMPLNPGTLFLDGGGYEMVDAASNPNTVGAMPANLPALDRFSASATLALVSGDERAGYGFRLAAGDVPYFIDLDRQGRYRVQRIGGSARTTLVDWTANAAIRAAPAANRLALDYAAGLLQIRVNDAPVGFVELPGPPGGRAAYTVGLIDDGGQVTTQVRCTRFTVRYGPVPLLDDRFVDNGSTWSLGPTFGIGGGVLRMDPPPKGADAVTYPEAVPPLTSFTALATIRKVSGPDDQWVGGIALLATNSAQVTFEIYGDGRYGIDTYAQGWHPLVRRSSPALHTGNASNTLFARYEGGALIVGANGVVLGSLHLPSPPVVGQVGLRTESSDSVQFSHFLLLGPSNVAAWALTPAPALRVDRILLRDDFAGNSGRWSLDPAFTAIRDHALRIAVRKADTTAWTNTTRLSLGSAYSVSATMRLTAVGHTDTPYGLLFQLDPADNSGEFLSFGVTADGYYDVGWLHKGAWQRDLVAYTQSDLVMRGVAANRLRVDMLGQVARFYLNGVRLGDVRLPVGAHGHQVGLETTTGNDLAVDEVQVTSLVGSAQPPVIRPIPRPTVQPRPQPPLDDPQRAAKARVAPAVVQVVVSTLFAHNRPAYGTGLIVLSDHTGVYVLTAHHVVNHVFPGDARRIQIQLPGGALVTANGLALLPGQAPANADLALIRLPPRPGLRAAVLGDSGSVDSPEQVLALGFPNIPGYSSSQPFVQAGTLQSAGERVAGMPGVYLAHSAAVAEGMSGGPLVFAQRLLVHGHDLLGQVIGINLDYARPASTGPQSIAINPALNLNLALPSNAARRALGTLLKPLHPGPYTLPR